MERVTVKLRENGYDVLIGGGAANELKDMLSPAGTAVVTDERVNELYGGLFDGYIKIVLPCGEQAKSFLHLQNILQVLTDCNFTRSDKIIAFGGGVVGDAAAFAASVYMRGIACYQLPTTLLSAVDSSVGGKTAINFLGVKNLVGSFYQPKGVWIDPKFMKSLPPDQWLCGCGEVAKTALLDRALFETLETEKDNPWEMSEESLARLIAACAAVKADVVAKDERETGLRKILNVGHTVGHAFEETDMNGQMRHGEYVLIGLRYELLMAKKLGLLDIGAYERMTNLVLRFKRNVPKIPDLDAFYELLRHDKKNTSDAVSFMLLSGVGEVTERKLRKEEVVRLLGEINEEI